MPMKRAICKSPELQINIKKQRTHVSEADATSRTISTSIAEDLQASTSGAAISTGSGVPVSGPSGTHNSETGLL